MEAPEVFINPEKIPLTFCHNNQIKSQFEDKLTRGFPPGATHSQQVKHDNLYSFWFRSKGLWFSKLVKLTVRLLSVQELLTISKIHHLDQAEFGVKMSWEHNIKEDSGHVSWCVDANQPGLVFTNKGLLSDSLPQIFDYEMVDDNQLVMTAGNYEETILLEGDIRRLRELRFEGKLIRRLWENKFVA